MATKIKDYYDVFGVKRGASDNESKQAYRLRLRNQGLNKRKGGRGDEYVRLKIVVPKDVSAEERRVYEELQRISRFEPRS